MISMEDLKVGDLLIRVDRTAVAYLRLDWLGPCDNRNPVDLIGPFFEQMLGEASQAGRGIDMHFEALAYLNSSAIAALVRFIKSAREAKVALRLFYDSAQRWQAVTFELLERALSTEDRSAGAAVEVLPAHP